MNKSFFAAVLVPLALTACVSNRPKLSESKLHLQAQSSFLK